MIIITGASRGIGQYLIKRFHNEKRNVVGTYLSTKPEENSLIRYFKVDVSKYDEVGKFVSSISSELHDITIINCAGINYNALAHKADIDKWKKVIEVNLIGPFNIIHALLPYMRKNRFGRIINLSSVVAQKGIKGTSAYASSKSGLWGLTKSIAIENAEIGITINNLNLGYFDIGMIKDVPENMIKIIKNDIPSRKLGEPGDIFNAIRFIIETEYINGTSIDINAGLY